MPKRVLILLAAVSLAVAGAACGGSSSPSPTPAPSVSYSPNPKITKAAIYVTILGSPAPRVPVEESTPVPGSFPPGRPGKAFATQNTTYKGRTTFYKLDPNTTYCWLAVLGKNSTASTCADWETWQTTTIDIGT